MTAGRPKSKIDWEKVNELLVAGCSGREIAGFIGVSEYTLYDRCESDNKLKFSQYSQGYYAKGDSLIRGKQYQLAMKGDKTMLVWLGKNRLKQRDGEDRINNNFIFKEIDPTSDATTRDSDSTSV